jgi:hypothetical protein
MTILRMRSACWVKTRSEYVMVIAVPLRQWLQESTTMLRPFVACVVIYVIIQSNQPPTCCSIC